MNTTACHAPAGDLASAIKVLTGLVDVQRGDNDTHFRNQLPCYPRAIRRIQEPRPSLCRVLDIGSHCLHQSVRLSELGYEVTGINIALFTGAGFVQERAGSFGIGKAAMNALEAGDFLAEPDGRFEMRNLVSSRGIGLSLDEIMGNFTHGQHWKEYSAREVHGFKGRSPRLGTHASASDAANQTRNATGGSKCSTS